MSLVSALEKAGTPARIRTFGLSWPLLVAMVVFLISLRPRLLLDPDCYWHVATARWMFEHFAVPAVDPFSFSLKGEPWVAHEWLAELAFGGVFEVAGWTGMAVLAAAANALAMAILCRYLLRHLEPAYVLAVVALADAMAMSHLLARPHALVLPLLVGWGVLLVEAREADRAPSWQWGLLMILWANIHASFMLGLAFAAAFAAEAAWETPRSQRWPVVKAWLVFLACALGATLATPYGIDGLLFPLMSQKTNESWDLISEWQSPNFHQFQPLELGLMVVGAAFLWRGIRLPAFRLILLLGLLHLALKHGRHTDILGLLAPLVLAQSVGAQWKPRAGTAGAATLDAIFAALAAPARKGAMVAVFAFMGLMAWAVHLSGELKPDPNLTPEEAIQAAQAAAPAGHVLNHYDFGGYLIYRGIPTYIDGRGEPFGDRFIADYCRALSLHSADGFKALLARPDIGWTLLRPTTPAVALLDQLPGWRRLYADERAVVHVRTGN